MSWFVSDDRVAVEVGECLCPGTPHPNGDTVWLRAELDLDGGLGINQAIADSGESTIQEALGRAYLMGGIVDWTFVDETGQKVPVNRQIIKKLRWGEAVFRLADRASEMYGVTALAPLVARIPTSSPNGRTAVSTSASKRSSSKRHEP